jgi:hypothetical protein
MISWPRSRGSSETPDSGITEFMLCSTLSSLPVTRKFSSRSSADGSLREMDIELMRRLSPRVNVIPVIGKADTFTPTELRDFKKRVRLLARQPLTIDHGGY